MSHQDYVKKHFEEQFEDSQMSTSQLRNQGAPVNQDDGEAIQLMRIKPSGQIQLNPQALDIISECDIPVGFVCLAGKYRTGKSFLLNKLLYLEGKGFKVDPSTKACTQGIWMWSKPIYNDREDNYIFFLDTEGSWSLNKDVDNDTKIFTLASLISSYFIYNSQGTIDQKSINDLNLVTKLSMNVLIQQNIKTKDNQEMLHKFMPKFLWLLRDFTLQLRDFDGNKIQPRQYLEDSLLDQNSLVRVSEDSRRIRRALINYFKERDCATLVRPVRQQTAFHHLNQLPEHALRMQFIEGVNKIREKIIKNTGPKVYDGMPLYGSSIASMIESYVQSMNNGSFPTIKTAWEHISDDEGAFAYNRALQQYHYEYNEYFSSDEPKGEQIHKILRQLRDNTLSEFNRNLSQPNQAYQKKLKELLSEKEDSILQINKELNECKNVEILKDLVMPLHQKINANQYNGDVDLLNKDVEDVVLNYKKKAKGESKGETLSQFLTWINSVILEFQKNNSDPQKDQMKEYEKEQYEKKIKMKDQNLQSLESQLEIYKKSQIKLKQQLKEKAAMGGANGGKVNSAIKDPKKGKSTGCCGADGPCSIM